MWDCRFTPVRTLAGGRVTLVTPKNRVPGRHSNPYLALLVMSAGHADTGTPRRSRMTCELITLKRSQTGEGIPTNALVRIPHCRKRLVRLLG
jgi:hypothetical protein